MNEITIPHHHHKHESHHRKHKKHHSEHPIDKSQQSSSCTPTLELTSHDNKTEELEDTIPIENIPNDESFNFDDNNNLNNLNNNNNKNQIQFEIKEEHIEIKETLNDNQNEIQSHQKPVIQPTESNEISESTETTDIIDITPKLTRSKSKSKTRSRSKEREKRSTETPDLKDGKENDSLSITKSKSKIRSKSRSKSIESKESKEKDKEKRYTKQYVKSVTSIQAYIRGYYTRKVYNSNQLIKRKYIVDEIFQTELNFVEQIMLINTVFKQPLENANGKILPKLLVRTIFNYIDEIMTSACVNANIFQKANSEFKFDSIFGKSMLSTLKNMLPLTEYTLRSDLQQQELKNAFKNKTFNKFVQLASKDPALNKLSLKDLLITPIQRLMRYHTLLSELLKTTPIKHKDYKYLIKADQKFHDLVIATNAKTKQHDQLLVCGSVIRGKTDLIQPWRYCLYYCECYVNQTKNVSVIFVFNDIMLWTDRVSRIIIDEKRSYYLEYDEQKEVEFKNIVKFHHCKTVENCYELATKDEKFTFLFKDSDHYTTWVNVIKKCLK